ncbi:MAG: DUF4296 domain-containing protein [Bacteroidales bacterium]
MMRTVFTLFLGLFLFGACSPQKVNPIPPKQFERILTDMQLATAFLGRNAYSYIPPPDSQNYYMSVVAHHGFTTEEFNRTIAYYARHPKQFDRVLEGVQRRIARMEGPAIVADSLYRIELEVQRKIRFDSIRLTRMADSLWVFGYDSVQIFRAETERLLLRKKAQEEAPRTSRPAGRRLTPSVPPRIR